MPSNIRARMLETKQKAKRMMLEQKLTQRDIAKKLGVSEKTISGWVKKYGWKEERDKRLTVSAALISPNRLTGFVDIAPFAVHLESVNPSLYKSLVDHLIIYLQTL